MRIGEIAGYLGEIAGYLAAVLVFLTFYMKTMIPLRMIGICSNCVFILYGSLDGLYPVLVLHLILLPLNGLRLREMLRLTQQVRRAAQGDLNMDWLKPFTSTHWARSGDVLFRKGEAADAMFFVVSGPLSFDRVRSRYSAGGNRRRARPIRTKQVAHANVGVRRGWRIDENWL
jgi:hypothetical protein